MTIAHRSTERGDRLTYPIPTEALDKHIAFLGGTGSGKTSGAKSVVVEPSLEAGERVVVIDPTSAWWGLRLGRDGKGKGFPIYIFGGDHGDYPLRARDAEVLAETFATSSDSAIFDTSLMTVSDRTAFFTDFAEAIRRKNRGPLKIVIDEAHLFMPQSGAKSGGAVPAMLHAGNNLVSLGRSRGLRITLISQRPAKLHKDSLTQVQSLVAMRLMAPQDRAAISDWIADQADPTKGKEIIASLPSLKPGEAWVWAPMAGVLETYAATLASCRATGYAEGFKDGASAERLEYHRLAVAAEPYIRDLVNRMAHDYPKPAAKPAKNIPENIPAAVAQPVERRASNAKAASSTLAGRSNGHDSLTAPQRRVLASIGFWCSVGTEHPTRAQVAGVAGYSPGSGGFNNLLGGLNTAGLITIPQPGRVSLADGAPFDHLDANGAREKVLSMLGAPQRKLVDAAISHVRPMSRESLAASTEYSSGSGGFNNLIGSLCTLTIFDKPLPGHVALSDWAREVLT